MSSIILASADSRNDMLLAGQSGEVCRKCGVSAMAEPCGCL